MSYGTIDLFDGIELILKLEGEANHKRSTVVQGSAGGA